MVVVAAAVAVIAAAAAATEARAAAEAAAAAAATSSVTIDASVCYHLCTRGQCVGNEHLRVIRGRHMISNKKHDMKHDTKQHDTRNET